MGPLQFNFGHPTKGILRLCNKMHPMPPMVIKLDTGESSEIDLPVDDLGCGQWLAELEWEHDDRNFCYKTEFEIPNAS